MTVIRTIPEANGVLVHFQKKIKTHQFTSTYSSVIPSRVLDFQRLQPVKISWAHLAGL